MTSRSKVDALEFLSRTDLDHARLKAKLNYLKREFSVMNPDLNDPAYINSMALLRKVEESYLVLKNERDTANLILKHSEW